LYGSIAARLVGGIKIANAVTGLGHVFTVPGPKARLARPVVRGLYRLALCGGHVRVIYQNDDDRDSFVGWGLVDKRRTFVIRGSGVDVERFRSGESGEEKDAWGNGRVGGVKILFASRLLREKGVFELVEAFDIIRSKYPQTELLVAGDLYPENPSSLSGQDVEKLKGIKGITYLGHVDDIPPLLADSDIVVLPSYREGTPRILIEAAAMEKPIVATDIAGCRGLVVDSENGFLVPVKSVEPLALAMEKLVADTELRHRMGRIGRKIVLDEFDETIVLKRTLEVYNDLDRVLC